MKSHLVRNYIIACMVAAFGGGVAVAQEQCPENWYWNGYKCAPEIDGGYYGPPGRVLPGTREDYDRYRQQHERQCYTILGRQICCPPKRTPQVGRGGRLLCCPRGWTIQSGVCKPYRGY
jgi:hypothetical protein